jgi:hypothetical protein
LEFIVDPGKAIASIAWIALTHDEPADDLARSSK